MTSSYRELVRRCWEEDRLLSILLELGYRCPLRCAFCYNDRTRRGVPLSLEQYRELLDDAAELGALFLTLSGGEPTIHPHFWEVGRRARELGFCTRIKTGGSHLRGDAIRRIRTELDPFVVELSLHGATPATHDRQTGVEGSFVRLLRAIDDFIAAGQRLELRTVLTAWNEHELERLFGLADSVGLPLVVDPEVTPRDDGDPSPLGLAASPAAVAKLQRLRAARLGGELETPPAEDGACAQGGRRRRCGAGTATVAVDPSGDVLPCVQWRSPVGNLHRARLSEIWRTSPELRRARKWNETVQEYLGSGMVLSFRGCPARLADRGREALPVLEQVSAEEQGDAVPIGTEGC